jgi:Tfp pilus assembly protein PilF
LPFFSALARRNGNGPGAVLDSPHSRCAAVAEKRSQRSIEMPRILSGAVARGVRFGACRGRFAVRSDRAVQGDDMTTNGAAGRIDDGLLLLEKGDYSGAEAAFRDAIRLDQACPEAHLRLGWVLLYLDQNLEAGAAFQSAIRLEPDAASAHEGLGLVLSREKRHAAAEAEYREAVRLAPGSAPACCRLGESLYLQGRYIEAEIAFRDAIRSDPGMAVARIGLGWALRQLRETAEAEKAFRDGISLDAGSADAHTGLGSVLWDAKRYAEAEAEFREAVRMDPSNAGAHRSLGRLLSSMNRHSEAQAEFRVAIKLEPGDVDAQQDLAEMKRDTGNPMKARYYRAAFERQERRAGLKSGKRVTTPPAILLRSPRARPLRRFLAGFVDIYMIPALFLFNLGYLSIAMGATVYVFNGYLEGKTGKSFGKALTGLHTIHGKTGKYLGGGKGILRRVLLVVDYIMVVGFIIGLFTGQTFTDAVMGTVVVWRPTWVTTKSKRKTAALERANYRRLRRRAGLLLYLFGSMIPKLCFLIDCRSRTGLWLRITSAV